MPLAHRIFQWSNEAPGKAAVHCVIVGFGVDDPPAKRLFEYADVKGEPHELRAGNINPYLVDAPEVVLANRRAPIAPVPPMRLATCPMTADTCCCLTRSGRNYCPWSLRPNPGFVAS
jgi:hypothetical protein